MKIAVMGAGGVGGYFGGLLAKSGQEVIFIARGQHLKAIQEHGLRVKSVVPGNFTVRARAVSSDSLGQIGAVDLVLFCVKTYHNPEAGPIIRPLIGEKTMIISLQNGVDNEDFLVSLYDREHVLGGVAHIEAFIAEPGVVAQTGGPRTITFGELDGTLSSRAQQILDTFRAAGIEATLSQNIWSVLWSKFVFICAASGVCGVARSPLGAVLAYPPTRELFVGVLREVEAVAHARGISLDPEIVPKTLRMAQGFEPTVKPSLLRDLEGGRAIEIEALAGAVVRMGRETGVPTPTNEFIYACLSLQNMHHQR